MNKQSIIQSIKSRTFIRDICLFIFMKCGFCSNYTRNSIGMDRTYIKLKKKYKKMLENFEITPKKEQKYSNFIWICWFQGIERAPELVKTCYKSVKRWYPDNDIVLITKENFRDYVDIPEYVISKWKKGKILNAHFSDILRLALLIKYGGLWIDATVFCTGNSWNWLKEKRQLFLLMKHIYLLKEMTAILAWI